MSVEWWVVLATVMGPIIAVQTQKWIERASENRRRKQWIFTSLMANRATRLADDYVKALNLIDLEFLPGRLLPTKNRQVIFAWRALFGELSHPPAENDANLNVAWNQRCDDRLVDLLGAMSIALGYNYSNEELRRGIYYPRGKFDLEQSLMGVAHGLKRIVDGDSSLPMRITDVQASPELAKLQATLNEKMISAYDHDGALKVRISHD